MPAKARVGIAHAVAAGAAATALVWLGPPGTDAAAHVYQRALFLQHGFELWNNYWYAGRYSYVTYSLLYYPAAALIGIKLLAVLSVGIAAAAFALVVVGEWPASGPWAARSFTVVSAAAVLTGAYPYALGIGLALASLVALREGRRNWFGALVLATLTASPLAFVLLVTVLAGVAASKRQRGIVRPVFAVAAVSVFGAALWRMFPSTGRFPFSAVDFAAALGFAAAGVAFTWGVAGARVLRSIFVAYGGVCIAAFLVPSGLGENVARLRLVAIPIAVLILSLRRWRPKPLALVALALAIPWNLTPLATSFARGETDPSASPRYWHPFVKYLRAVLTPGYRVEVVATAGHWEAAYVAGAGIPLARGWFRQDDFPQNRPLYGDLDRTTYQRWLRRLGIEYVLLTDAPADYSARGEAALLRGGHSGLQPVLRTTHGTVYRVSHPTSMLTGRPGAYVRTMGAANIVVELPEPGRYRLAVRYSPYWTSRSACVLQSKDDMTVLVADRPGVISIRFSLTADRILSTAVGSATSCR